MTVDTRSILVYDPTATENGQQSAIAARPPSLDGRVIALLDNTKDLVDVLLGEAKDLILKDYPTASFRYFRKESVSGAKPDLMEQVAACDAVITAVGD